jgi:general secretion pathway protein A
MHEDYYGFTEKPFSLTPDPKYLFKSQSHASAFELLQYAIRRREGFVVVTGDIGTGKTTLCRAILQQLDRKTFTALILNPFLSEEDLLRLILVDFGVVSRDEAKRGRLAGVTKQELIDTLNEFLLSLLPLGAGALLIIDEAQNLPLQVLEQIRILSNLETDKEKLLQIVLVGQRNLKDLLKSPELRQLDQRISIRYELEPLNREETAAYIAHRLAIAGGGAAVSFAPRALDLVHRYTGGIPRLINLLCDRSLLGGYSARTARITPDLVTAAATTLELRMPRRPLTRWFQRRAAAFAAGVAAMAVVAGGTYAAVLLQDGSASAEQLVTPTVIEATEASAPPAGGPPDAPAPLPGPPPASEPTAGAAAVPAAPTGTPVVRVSVVVGSFRQAAQAERLTGELEAQGYRVRMSRIDTGARGVWHQVLVGPYTDVDQARDAEGRIQRIPGYSDARLISH